MQISVGGDHRGVDVKGKLIELLQRLGHEVHDVGVFSAESADYPDVAAEVAQSVGCGKADRGILICGTGIGMAIAANKIRGVRAAACYDELTAELSRRHNDLNVLCLSADMLGERNFDRLIETWLTTEFEGGRHQRRVDKIRQLDDSHDGPC